MLLLILLGTNACLPRTKEEFSKPVFTEEISKNTPNTDNWSVYKVSPLRISLPPNWQGINTSQSLFSLSESLPSGTIFFAQNDNDNEQVPATLLLLEEDIPLINSVDKYLTMSIHNLKHSGNVIGNTSRKTTNINLGQVEVLNFHSKNYDERGLLGHVDMTNQKLHALDIKTKLASLRTAIC